MLASPENFRDCFVVRVQFSELREDGWGTGVLLAPRVVATCRHVTKSFDQDNGRVMLGSSAAGAVAVTWPNQAAADTSHEDSDRDVAFLFLDRPLGPVGTMYPGLSSKMTSTSYDQLKPRRKEYRTMSCGFQFAEPKITPVTIDNETWGRSGVVDWSRLAQSYRQGSSGGPIWLTPPKKPRSIADAINPGLVLGLIAQGAITKGSGGPPNSFAVMSDTLVELLRALQGDPLTTPEQAKLLGEVRVIEAEQVIRPRDRQLFPAGVAALGIVAVSAYGLLSPSSPRIVTQPTGNRTCHVELDGGTLEGLCGRSGAGTAKIDVPGRPGPWGSSEIPFDVDVPQPNAAIKFLVLCDGAKTYEVETRCGDTKEFLPHE